MAQYIFVYTWREKPIQEERANDALHLAIAANQSASAIYTLDKGLVSAGKTLGLPVKRGIRAQ